MGFVEDNWSEFNGWCLSPGPGAAGLHPSDLCDKAYYYLVKDLDERERMRMDQTISIPPANIAPSPDDPMWSAEAEMSFFKKA